MVRRRPDTDDEFGFTDAGRAFAAALRERTADWASAGGRLHPLQAAVHFAKGRVRGDRLHDQLFTLPDRPSGWGCKTTGTVEELAARSARWFRTVLDKPVVLYVWLNTDRSGARAVTERGTLTGVRYE